MQAKMELAGGDVEKMCFKKVNEEGAGSAGTSSDTNISEINTHNSDADIVVVNTSALSNIDVLEVNVSSMHNRRVMLYSRSAGNKGLVVYEMSILNLPLDVTARDVFMLFEPYGPLLDIRLLNPGGAIIVFERYKNAVIAFDELDGKLWKHRPIKMKLKTTPWSSLCDVQN
ncbi:nucleolar protein 3-like [Scaptodrosophila lebanonensis]|uniref:Nucleolar protein 3-like n=1 Tax=Drosophila lebanonensis TaxID=7225 RepID=A0A6J2TZK3_DROLE|nr:nucleolar protein 3-like [Scaptodrosophila lebanonensis]